MEIAEGAETDFVDRTIFQKNLDLFSSADWIYKTTPNFLIKATVGNGDRSIDVDISCEKAAIRRISFARLELVDDRLADIIDENIVGADLCGDILNYRLELCRMKLAFGNDGSISDTDEAIIDGLEGIFKDL